MPRRCWVEGAGDGAGGSWHERAGAEPARVLQAACAQAGCPRPAAAARPLQMDIEDADDAESALTLSNPVLESLEK